MSGKDPCRCPRTPQWRNPVHFLATGFGSGLLPKMPGTFGTLAAVPCYLLVRPESVVVFGLLILAMFAVGVVVCGRTSRDLQAHDHPSIVWDEFVGFFVTMLFAPPGLWPVVLGFVLFRIFDIIKPWPIRWFDRRVHGGFGIMLDDVIAGLFAAAVLGLIMGMVTDEPLRFGGG